MMKEHQLSPAARTLPFVFALVLPVAGLALCLKGEYFQKYYFTSDTMYMFNYFYSLRDGTLASFQYSHLPNIFPEGMVVLPLLAAGVPWQFVYACYSVAAFFVLALSVRQICRTVSPEAGENAFYIFTLVALPIFLLHPGRFLHALLMGIHGGSFVVSVLCTVLAWRFLSGTSRRSWWILLALVLLTGATTFSDVLFVFEFVIPLALVSSVLALFRYTPPRRSLTLALAVIAASAIGALILHRLPISPFPPSSPGDLLDNTRRFFASIQANLTLPSLLPLAVVAVCFLACVYPKSARPPLVIRFCGPPLSERTNAGAWLFFWLFGLAASLVGFAVTIVSYVDFGAFRYAIATYWWPLILGVTLLARVAAPIRRLLPWAAAAGIAGLGLLAAILPRQDFWATDLARCLKEKSRSLSMHAGLAEYWTARPVTEFLDRKLVVSQVVENGDPMIWINNRLDYFADREGKQLRNYDFVILNALNRAEIETKFGPPSHTFHCGAYDIAQYDHASPLREKLARSLGAGS